MQLPILFESVIQAQLFASPQSIASNVNVATWFVTVKASPLKLIAEIALTASSLTFVISSSTYFLLAASVSSVGVATLTIFSPYALNVSLETT